MCSGTHWISRPRATRASRSVVVPAAVADVPLPGRDDLERALALLVELHRVGDLLRLAVEVAGLAEQLHDPLLGAEHGLAGQLRVRLGGDVGRRLGQQAAVPADDRPGRQPQLAPPGDVVEVAEGADHRDARALVRLGQAVGDHGHLDVEQRRPHRLPEEARVTGVVGVGDQRDAGGDQLGPGGLDEDRALRPGERDPVVRPGPLAVLELGLRDRRPEGDVPEGRRLLGVGLAAGQVVQEHPLGRGPGVLRDRPVDVRPVDRQPDPAPELLEGELVLLRQLHAELDEVAPRDRQLVLARLLGRGERRVVVQRRVAPRRRSSSAPGARWAGRCRPSPSGSRRAGRACAGSGRRCRCGCS